jgi:hypothetical protein
MLGDVTGGWEMLMDGFGFGLGLGGGGGLGLGAGGGGGAVVAGAVAWGEGTTTGWVTTVDPPAPPDDRLCAGFLAL